MFERFTDRARRVLVLAQEEARLLDHNFIGTEHLLLGLIHESEGVAAQALQAMGISLEAVRVRVDETVGPPGSPSSGPAPFTPRAKKVLELSLREALQLGHNYIGTEHLLLGLVREGEGVAAQVLVSLGADLALVRHQVIDLLARYQPADWVRPAGAPAGGFRPGRPGRRVTPSRPPRPPSGVRPADSLPALSGEVELTHRDERLSGTVAGEAVDMALVVHAHDGRADGTFAGVTVSATWMLADAEAWHPDLPASVHGTFGAVPLHLRAWIHLGGEFGFGGAAIEGEISGQPIAASIDTAEGGFYAAHGYFADAAFSLRAGFDGERHLEGSVEGAPLRLALGRVDEPAPATTLVGRYEGPVPLLLVCGAVLLSFSGP
jgi:hypothetical protein